MENITEDIINAIQKTPIPTILILAGLFFILLGLVLNFVAIPLSIPSGSYLKTCQNISVKGDILYAFCKTLTQQYNPTSLEIKDCKSTISNINGSLQCDN